MCLEDSQGKALRRPGVWLSGKIRGRVLAKYMKSPRSDPQHFRRGGEGRRAEGED